MDAPGLGVLLPHAVIGGDVHTLDPVQSDHVKFPHRFVVLRRVAGGGDDPAVGETLIAEGLALEKLEHHGGQGFRDAVDLIQEEDALLDPGVLHGPVDRGQDLAHGVLGDRAGPAAEGLLPDEGEAQSGLPGVVGDGIAHQADAHFAGDLFHDLGLANARRTHEEKGTLPHRRDAPGPQLIPGQVGPDGILDLLFGAFNIHGCASSERVSGWGSSWSSSSSSSRTRMPQGGTRSGKPW